MFSYVDVDLLDPTILREDIDDLRATYEHTTAILFRQFQEQTENIQSEMNSAVKILQGKIDELNGWKAESETEQRSLDQRIIEMYGEITSGILQVNNHANTLDHVVLEHHPESYADLGYTLHEETTPNEEEVSNSTPTPAAQPEAPSLRLEVITPH